MTPEPAVRIRDLHMLVAIGTVVTVATVVSIVAFVVHRFERVRSERIIAHRLQIVRRSHL